MAEKGELHFGDSCEVLKNIETESIDLIYMDPPFFTQKEQKLKNRDNTKEFKFDDKWGDLDEYLALIKNVMVESRRVLKNTGSVFLHCDKYASHYLRVLLDEVFGTKCFQSEIIWVYKRWSNSKKGLLNSHQNIYFYSKSSDFKFNYIYTDYAPSTNIDQILQARVRDKNGKSIYKKDSEGNVVTSKEKKGVPLSDVWNIPYLNPKAKERVGYPTQKPVLLLNQILNLASDENDVVLDPFCGSGTTCVSASLLNRKYIGIDRSPEAISLCKDRLETMIVSDSQLLKRGEDKYIEKSAIEIAILNSIDAFPVQRNSGIDGFLKKHFNNKPVPVKIQGNKETLEQAISNFEASTQEQDFELKVLIQTNDERSNMLFPVESDIKIVKASSLQIKELFKDVSSLDQEYYVK